MWTAVGATLLTVYTLIPFCLMKHVKLPSQSKHNKRHTYRTLTRTRNIWGKKIKLGGRKESWGGFLKMAFVFSESKEILCWPNVLLQEWLELGIFLPFPIAHPVKVCYYCCKILGGGGVSFQVEFLFSTWIFKGCVIYTYLKIMIKNNSVILIYLGSNIFLKNNFIVSLI